MNGTTQEIVIDSQNSNSSQVKIININKADSNELQELKGIGESTATAIIQYREENGDFETIEDIKNVQGIGENKFELIKDYIKVK